MENIFRIKVCRRTKNGALEPLVDSVVRTTSTLNEIRNSYVTRYAGLLVNVEEVENVVVEKDVDETFIVRRVNGYSTNSYNVTVKSDSIEGFREICNPVKEAQQNLADAKVEFTKQIAEKLCLNLAAIKHVELFESHITIAVDGYSNLMVVKK